MRAPRFVCSIACANGLSRQNFVTRKYNVQKVIANKKENRKISASVKSKIALLGWLVIAIQSRLAGKPTQKNATGKVIKNGSQLRARQCFFSLLRSATETAAVKNKAQNG